MYSKKIDGSPFEPQTIEAVWQKGQIVIGQDSNNFRKDKCGHFIKRDAYGNVNHKYGWEIDHDKPKSKGGGDELSNLQPLYWENNRAKGNDWPQWVCKFKG